MGLNIKKQKLLADVGRARKASGVNQLEFWTKFGVTQSGGSRYESGRSMPRPLNILIWLYDAGKINDQDLADAMKGLK